MHDIKELSKIGCTVYIVERNDKLHKKAWPIEHKQTKKQQAQTPGAFKSFCLHSVKLLAELFDKSRINLLAAK